MKKMFSLVVLSFALACGVTFTRCSPRCRSALSTAMIAMATNPQNLRQQAARIFYLAMATRDAALSQKLKLKAAEYFDRATELERQQVTTLPPAAAPDLPRTSS